MNTIKQLLSTAAFHYGDQPDAWQAWYPEDDSWQQVTLPHDWAVTMPFSKDCSSGTGYLSGGIAWYRITLPPITETDAHYHLYFENVYKHSRVWCNSTYLGHRPNGYISFNYDVTGLLHADRENVISVKVEHPDLADSRWFTGSGITGKVWLVQEDPVHLVPDTLFFRTEKGDFTISAKVTNDSLQPVSTYLSAALDDTSFNGIPVILNAGETELLTLTGSVSEPRLWSPDAPNLYTMTTSLVTDDTASVQDVRKVGFRDFRFDAATGFYLNEVPTTFKGVCVHHDAGALGAAVPRGIWKLRLEKLKKMGCNAIRMSHNPHGIDLYELCDELGFLVMDEAFDEWEGPKNKWWQGHNVYPPKHQGYYLDYPEWHERDLTDMVLRDRNHPSIVMWSIGNEVDYPNDPYCHPSFETMTGNNDKNKPAAERQYNPQRPNAERLAPIAKELAEIVRKADATRPVTLAAAFPELSSHIGFLDALDVAGYNYKEHLYEESHERFPDLPFLGSENSHSLQAWKAVTDNDYISGQFLWTGIDYLGEAHGWPIHGSGAGLITTAGFEKWGYGRRQSFWSDEPVISMVTTPDLTKQNEWAKVTESWNYPIGSEVLIKIYTNQPEVELKLNDRFLGKYSKDPNKDAIEVVFSFVPGILTATAGPVSAVLSTTMAPARISAAVLSDYADEQIVPIAVTICDSMGRRVVNDQTLIQVEALSGQLITMDNGDLSDVTEYKAPYRHAYHGQLMVYAAPGSVLKLSSEALPPVTVEC